MGLRGDLGGAGSNILRCLNCFIKLLSYSNLDSWNKPWLSITRTLAGFSES